MSVAISKPKPWNLRFQTVVETFPVSEALGQLIAADLIQLLLLADQMRRKWQATGALCPLRFSSSHSWALLR